MEAYQNILYMCVHSFQRIKFFFKTSFKIKEIAEKIAHLKV